MADIDAAQWDALLADQPQANPFLRHAYLQALESSASACPETGWTPCHVTLHREGEDAVIAAAPMYLKSHSWGEYVFDFAWARAYAAHGRAYYPKALIAVPFTPVPGPRLLARNAADRAQLITALPAIWRKLEVETAHVLFLDEQQTQALRDAGWLQRQGVQFHWHNRHPATLQPFTDFDDFLSSLQRDKRRKIRQEMRRVAEAGVTYRVLRGAAITAADWAFFRACYETTYLEHGNAPYLTAAFWEAMRTTMPDAWLLIVAMRAGQPIACSLLGMHERDDGIQTVYGRYWGALQRVDLLHFDLCYYQTIAWCIAHRVQRFEGGAQGEHKLARALLPAPTHSAHWIADAHFAAALKEHLAQESQAQADYTSLLAQHSPFRRG
ncbi:GNAT family N-acetyltransferase [Lampropedia cohaerens]|nr:GNAT family N-acetyltransferase [Lampropedia cohaerens]